MGTYVAGKKIVESCCDHKSMTTSFEVEVVDIYMYILTEYHMHKYKSTIYRTHFKKIIY